MKKKLCVAIVTRKNDAFSLTRYRENIEKELGNAGVSIRPFDEKGPIPEGCDLTWDPGIAGIRRIPEVLKYSRNPLILTVHGAAPFTLSQRENSQSIHEAIRTLREKRNLIRDWSWMRKKVSAIIAVSEYGAREINRALALPESIISSIHHGVDRETFFPSPREEEDEKSQRFFFLHVSQYQPKKNLVRLLRAYEGLSGPEVPPLIIVSPGFPYDRHRSRIPEGVTVYSSGMSPEQLAELYRKAIAFVFPSLHETFGLPILEAMSCGCPVICSDRTACPEIVGDAGLLVDPRSVAQIRNAMQTIIEDVDLRGQLAERGLRRANSFTWHESARQHIDVFARFVHVGSTGL